MSDRAIVLDQPGQIAMYYLLVQRHRLHLELKVGRQCFRQSTLVLLRNAGITNTRNRWVALYDLNQRIAADGGPPDRQSLALQKLLNAEYPPKGRG